MNSDVCLVPVLKFKAESLKKLREKRVLEQVNWQDSLNWAKMVQVLVSDSSLSISGYLERFTWIWTHGLFHKKYCL